MRQLELKIPPPAVAVACALLAWLLARWSPWLLTGAWRTWAALACLVGGVGVAAWGVLTFRRAGTTLNPQTPDASRNIVRTGPFRFSRNPMYLGMSLVLSGYCLWLGSLLALLAVIAFVAYITRFQIVPEERVLVAKFGAPYQDYLRSVRRWL